MSYIECEHSVCEVKAEVERRLPQKNRKVSCRHYEDTLDTNQIHANLRNSAHRLVEKGILTMLM